VIHLRPVEKPGDNVHDFRMPTLGHLAFTPDGTRLVAGGMSSTMISVWRVSDGRLLNEIGPTAGGYRTVPIGVAEDPDPARAGIAPRPDSRRRTEIRLWDIETGERLRDLSDPEEIGFGDVALSPDGRRMAIVNFSGIRLVEIATLKPQWTIDLPGWWGRPVAFSSDGRLVALPEQNAVAIFEVATGRRLHHDDSTPVGRVGAVEWSPSGDRIVTGHSDGHVRVWDAATGRLIWHKLLAPIVSVAGEAADPISVGFSRNGKLLVAAGDRDYPSDSGKGIVVVYEAATGEVAREIPQGWLRLKAPAPDGRMVVVAWYQLFGIEAMTGRQRRSTPTANKPADEVEVAALQFEVNPTWFYAALRDGAGLRHRLGRAPRARSVETEKRTSLGRRFGFRLVFSPLSGR
jgi:WD40 repeat protein